MTAVAIRKASVADAEALAAVYRSAYAENRRLGFPTKAADATADTVANWIEDSSLFIADQDGEIVGGVRLEVTGPDRVKLSRLGVHEAWKGEGIGGKLLRHAETVVQQWGRTIILLTTPPEHPYLPALYRDRGYEKTGDYPLEYREYDEEVMEKRLR